MKKGFLFLVIIIIVVNITILTAQDKPETKPDIYDPHADVKALITSGMKTAQEQNKNLLLMFGGNWCLWCHKLHDLFQSDEQIKALLGKSFIIIMVDVGEKHGKPLNRDLEKKYRVGGFGYPALVVLGKDGMLVSAQSTGVLEKGKGHDPGKVLWYLKSQAPGE